jgi:hypothetical protein
MIEVFRSEVQKGGFGWDLINEIAAGVVEIRNLNWLGQM